MRELALKYRALLWQHWPEFNGSLVVGLTLALVTIPQAVAFSVTLAGVPPQFGINADLDAWQLAGFIWASGGQSLSDDLTTLTWDQEPALKAIQFMADLVNVHKVAPAPSGGDAKTFDYATGKLAMKWSYPSQLTYRYNSKLPWDWTLAPEPQAGAPRTTVLYNLWTMNAKSKYQDESLALTSFLAGPVATRVDTELGWAMPAFKSDSASAYRPSYMATSASPS